jgi:hypothetical protein
LLFGSIAIEMTGSGNVGGSSSDVEIFVAQGIAGGDVAETDQGRDVAREHLIDILALAA